MLVSTFTTYGPFTDLLNPGVYVYPYEEHIDYNYAYMPIIIESDEFGKTRDEVWGALKACGVETRKLYDTLTCDFTYYKDKGYKKDVKHAEEMVKKCLDFPMYSELSEEDIDYIGRCLEKLKV